MSVLLVFYWDFSKYWLVFNVFGSRFHLNWYGLLFSIGVCVSVLLGFKFIKNLFLPSFSKNSDLEKLSYQKLVENFLLSLTLFLVVGARLGYVLFYGFPYYVKHPASVLKIWEGGLSSHGAILGLLLCIFLFVRKAKRHMSTLNFFFITDIAAVTFGFSAFMIRIGNLFNQEIVGNPTSMPWGIIFSEPTDGIPGIPLHPVQIYEGLGYLIIFISFLLTFFINKQLVGKGRLTAFGCIFISLVRFIAEFFKSHQGMLFSEASCVSMGQLLSIPLFLFGIVILAYDFVLNRNVRKTER